MESLHNRRDLRIRSRDSALDVDEAANRYPAASGNVLYRETSVVTERFCCSKAIGHHRDDGLGYLGSAHRGVLKRVFRVVYPG